MSRPETRMLGRIACAVLLVLAGQGRAGLSQAPRVDGPARVLLAADDLELIAPAWSPSGDRIAFTSGGFAGIWVLDVAKGEATLVTNEPATGYGFQWSPDGRALLARAARFDGLRRTNAVKVFDLEDGSEVRLTEYRTSMPSLPRWAGDGTRVLLHTGGRLEILPSSRIADPTKVAPDAPGYVLKDAGLARVDSRTGSVTAMGDFAGARVVEFAPSPDRARVAVRVVGEGLFVVDSDGSDVVSLGNGNFPSWSPDGEWLAYARVEDDGHVLTSADLFVARADGAVNQALVQTSEAMEMYPTWSPDGQSIAYSDRGKLYQIRLSYP